MVCDLGCGRGTTTLALAARLTPAWLIALDRFPALLTVVADRAARAGHTVQTVCADFHHLPLFTASLDTAVAAFCLYHLAPTGQAVLVTKSADSYHEIDQVIADSGLDPDATTRPSLYTSFHGDTAAQITTTALRVAHLVRQRHLFCPEQYRLPVS